MKKKAILLAFAASVLCLQAWSQTTVKTISGKVVDAKGKPVSGVVVNDGRHFMKTGADGRWSFNTDTCLSKMISISTPADYMLNNEEGQSAFYIPVRKAIKSSDNTFVITKRRRPVTDFVYLAISDPQVRNESEMNRWRNETVKDIRHLVDSLRSSRTMLAMTLGDLVFDAMPLYPEYAASCKLMGIPVYQTIGNHDFDKHYQDLHNMRYGTRIYAEHYYHDFFGPTDYSFNIGNVHVVSMKNINYVGRRKYIEALTDEQLAWLEKDLSYVAKGTTVFLNMHAAGWNVNSPDGNIRNAEELKNILKDYKAHVFCGHTHYYQNVIVSPTLFQHNIGAACGAWWAGDVCVDGAPNGYLIVDVKGDDVRWHYKPTGKDVSYQFRLYKPGQFRRDTNSLVANVWDYDDDCKVEWSQDGKDMGSMERFFSQDEMYIRQQNAHFKDVKEDDESRNTGHLFRCHPSKNAKTIKVTFTNHFGEKFSQTIELNR